MSEKPEDRRKSDDLSKMLKESEEKMSNEISEVKNQSILRAKL